MKSYAPACFCYSLSAWTINKSSIFSRLILEKQISFKSSREVYFYILDGVSLKSRLSSYDIFHAGCEEKMCVTVSLRMSCFGDSV